MEAAGGILSAGQDGRTEILVKNLILLSVVGCALASAQMTFTYNGVRMQVPYEPDMSLAKILPFPGKFGGYAYPAGKVILLPGEDDTKKTLPAETAEIPKRSNDFTYELREGRVAGLSQMGTVGLLSCISVDTRVEYIRAAVNLLPELEKGRVVGFDVKDVEKDGQLTIEVADATTGRVTKTLRYRFTSQSTIAWDSQNQTLVWRGFSVRQ